MLIFTGDQGRKVINTIYPSLKSAVAFLGADDFHALPHTQTLIYWEDLARFKLSMLPLL